MSTDVSATKINQFRPDYTVSPGEILKETLEARGIKKADFAAMCGLPVKTVMQIIRGKEPVTPETAILFERELGVPAYVWNSIESSYRFHLAGVLSAT
ncbi:MAG: helix-turn-helix domain-containing protein [Nitrospirae bacterium]|nr:helix-turn-helix domain-containing protein [Nitrospirota bacterium]